MSSSSVSASTGYPDLDALLPRLEAVAKQSTATSPTQASDEAASRPAGAGRLIGQSVTKATL